MSASCGLCERDLEHGYLCAGCTRRLAERLGELPTLYDEVGQCLVPRGTGFGEIVSTRRAAGPRSPINEDILDTITWGRASEVMHLWRVDVQRERWPQHAAPPLGGLAADCRWLAMELDWITSRYPAVGELAREVGELEHQARSVVGDPAPRPQRLGTCVAVDVEGVVCGAVIKRMPGETRLCCKWCGYVYESEKDLLLLLHYQPTEGEDCGPSRAA